jgi:hypothetical protein
MVIKIKLAILLADSRFEVNKRFSFPPIYKLLNFQFLNNNKRCLHPLLPRRSALPRERPLPPRKPPRPREETARE